MSAWTEVKGLVAEARQRVGLEDLGGDAWREPLGRLLESVEAEAGLTDVGRRMVRTLVVDRLVNRLEVRDWVSRHPAVQDEVIEAPLVLATLPRTGQTAAGWIFDRDPANRSLRTWFVKRPCPPPWPGPNHGDARIERERTMIAAMPRALRAMHLHDAEEPDECHWLLSNAFRTPHEIYSMRVPDYYRWVRDDPGITHAYEEYRLQLQILQSRTPGRRWVLKNSPHLLYLDALHAVLPDAIFVQLHRDPLKVLASNCQLAMLLRGLASDRVDAHEVGASMLQLLRDYVDRLMRFRRSGVSRPWIDVRFAEFVADPLGVVSRIHAQAGIPLSDEARSAMAGWVAANPRDPGASVRAVDLASFGIPAQAAKEAFADYVDAFGLEYDGI